MQEVQRQLKTLKPYLFSEDANAAADAQKGGATIREGLINSKYAVYDNKSEESSSEEEDEEEIVQGGAERKNKPVTRLDKLTKTERN